MKKKEEEKNQVFTPTSMQKINDSLKHTYKKKRHRHVFLIAHVKIFKKFSDSLNFKISWLYLIINEKFLLNRINQVYLNSIRLKNVSFFFSLANNKKSSNSMRASVCLKKEKT